MKVEIDDQSGFCFGVTGAICEAEKALASGTHVWSLGDIVHNRLEMERLSGLGLRVAGHDRLPELAGETVLIRAHGEPPSTYRTAQQHGIRIIDATCPVVARLQQTVALAHRRMTAEGGRVVILGKKGHAEVAGLVGQTDGGAPVTIVERMEDLNEVDHGRPVYFLSQTTQSLALFRRLGDEITARAARPGRTVIDDTICRRVSDREIHLREFAARHDVILFVSGRKSSNGRALYETCSRVNPRSHFIEDAGEIDPQWFAGVETTGICGATSTPRWLMERVARAVREIPAQGSPPSLSGSGLPPHGAAE